MLRRYVHGPGSDEPIVWYEGAGTSSRRFLQADERGSVVAVSDSSGASLGINRYDEYGIPQTGNLGRFSYTGQTALPEIGLMYYKARMYSPGLGRFMQTDPIGYGDGLGWYNYVGSDPVNFVDPSGLMVCEFRQPCPYVDSPDGWDVEGEIVVQGRRLRQLLTPTDILPIQFDLNEFIDQIVVRACRAVSEIGERDRIRFGGDASLGVYGYFRGGAGLSVDRKGSIWLDGYLGMGAGFAAAAAGGVSYQFNAPTSTQVTATGQLALGIGLLGGTAQVGYGSDSGPFEGGSVTAAIPIATPIPSGKFGGEVGATINAELAEPLTEPIC